MTAHRGTVTGHEETVIGDDNLFMAYSHVAHDCVVGSRTVFANSASLSGHVVVEDDVVLGGFVAVRQFCRVGRFAYVGGMTPVNKDVLPFTWTSSDRDTKACKINGVGLSRKGYSAERVASLQKAYRILHRNRHDHVAALAALGELAESAPDVGSSSTSSRARRPASTGRDGQGETRTAGLPSHFACRRARRTSNRATPFRAEGSSLRSREVKGNRTAGGSRGKGAAFAAPSGFRRRGG